LARDLSVAGASVLFSMWVTFASGYQVVYQALVVILAGLVLYAFLNARRQRLGESAEPEDLPDDIGVVTSVAVNGNDDSSGASPVLSNTRATEVKV
jgi:hypothetical protein